MKISMLEGNLQILLRSKKDEKQKAISMFFDPKDCHDLYPDFVDCGRKGSWTKLTSGSQKQPKGDFKVWAEYTRIATVTSEVKDDGEEL